MIDEQALHTFETDGAVVLRGLLDAGWIQSLRDVMPEILERTYDPSERTSGRGTGQIRQLDGMWRGFEAFARFLFQSPVGAVAAEVMRSSTARLYEDLLLYKDSGADGSASWHRDSPYWPLSGSQLSSVWFSLETVTNCTGAMQIRGRLSS